ncbi:MAG: aldo/keto reductase, partial [Pseudomonadota bacterium]
MSQGGRRVSRRAFLRRLAGLAAGLGTGLAGASWKALAADDPLITRAIHATGERVPVIGMGSSLTFDVGDDPVARAVRVQVLQAFFDHGGAFIDSSPMYGFSEDVIGHCLASIKNDTALFSATKVWTPGQRRGRRQMKRSMGLWGLEAFDLMQIHNMLDWESHLETLKQWKEEGRIRYVGITTSHGRRHERLEKA